MEILIVGVILVALMAWASTRIKRNAAAAFEAETIETGEFTLKKPDGWLSVVDPREPYIFEGYTKDLGSKPNENIRLGTAAIEVSNAAIDDVVTETIAGAEITDDIREVINERHYRIVELTRTEDDIDRIEWLKFAEANGSVYTFRIKALAEATVEFRRDVGSMLDSFELK